jgi:hypothetical protein
MATAEGAKETELDVATIREDWLKALRDLLDRVQGWAEELDWSTRRVEKEMKDSQLGRYRAPALVLQKETTRALLNPYAHAAPGEEGIVDFLQIPAWDDVARLVLIRGKWHLIYEFPRQSDAETTRNAHSKPLSKKSFQLVLEELITNASCS